MPKPYRPSWCNSSEHLWRPSRREFLQVGSLGAFGLTLGRFLELQARGASVVDGKAKSKEPAAKSVIHIYLPGGMAAQESWDPKLLAPLEYRGPLGTVRTKIDGVHFSEHLSKTAQMADRITVIRSMTHGEADHDRGTHNMFTGYRPSPALQFPSFGSVVSHELGSRNDLPPYVCIPNLPTTFAGTGYLGSAFGPFSLGNDPAAGDFKVRDLSLPDGITEKRFNQRKEMRAIVDSHFSQLEKSDALAGMDSFYARAYSMVSSEKARAAFSIKDEPDKLRDEYGRNEAGQRMLLARRLVAAGVRFVSLTYGGWDHHDNIKNGIGNQLPRFDQAFATLIRDLDERGMLDSTLVLVSSEFGRTPKINATGGRDHYPKVFSVVMAGGGVKRGYAHGASDVTGGEPDHDPVTVPNLAATLYQQIGIDYEKALLAPGDRPVKIVKDGEVVTGVIA
ncbi:MAG: DUF1501 domain-containing protein [Verrucomicrobia bacterium]|nr:DUF1501 domain-containing protein [Verrucomicrobiota bacterium]